MIVVEHLRKTYPDLRRGEVVAVDDVSFRAEAGQVYGLLGPNGAGKTTLLRILATLLRPTAGRAEVAGIDVTADPLEVRRRIGYVSASTGLYDRMTAYEMVAHFGRLHGLSGAALKERIETLFDRLRMNDFRDRVGGKLSTGMRQKVGIARALVHDPPVVIFDEPTSGLDVLVARAVLDVIRSCRNPGRAVIFSTHIMHEAESLCDRITIVHRGRNLITGTLAELRSATGQERLDDIFFSLVGEEDIQEALRRGSRA
jgi:sodium transport system ATP-binding protein